MGRKWYKRIKPVAFLPASTGLDMWKNKEKVGDMLMDVTEPLHGTKAARAARQTAKEQEAFGRESLDLQREMFETGREDLAPWREAGKGALAEMVSGMESGRFDPSGYEFEADPGYQFRLAEGEKALGRSAAARGGRMGGRTLKELMRYGQGLASDEYQRGYQRHAGRLGDIYNRLAGVAGTGQTTSQSMANLGEMYGQQAGAGLQNIGNVRAAGIMGQQQAKSQGMQNLWNLGGQLGAAYLSGGASLPFMGGKTNQPGNVSPMAMYGGFA